MGSTFDIHRSLAALALVVAQLASGCAAPAEQLAHKSADALDGKDAPPGEPSDEPFHAATPMRAFVARGAVATAFAPYGGGEPGIAASPDGTLFVTFYGCDKAPDLLDAKAPPFPAQATSAYPCNHPPTFASTDDGQSWKRLNRDGDGRLADGPASGSDPDVATDASGRAYLSTFGGGIHVYTTDDGGQTWTDRGDASTGGGDRPWIVGGPAGTAILEWNREAGLAVRVTRDGAQTWGDVSYVGPQAHIAGRPAFYESRGVIYVPFVADPKNASITDPATLTVKVGRSDDGGATWTARDVATFTSSALPIIALPTLAVDPDGRVFVAWSEETTDATGTASLGARVLLATSADRGETWSPPVQVGKSQTAIWPIALAPHAGHAMVAYYASDMMGDPSYVGRWRLEVASVDDVGSAEPKLAYEVVDPDVHAGGICMRGAVCFATGSDWSLRDTYAATLMRDGRIAIAYPADAVQNAKRTEIRFAVQDS